MTRTYGWRRPARHVGLKVPHAAIAMLLRGMPDRGDLASVLPPIWDQGQLGSCTGHAVARALFALQRWQGRTPFEASRLALYYGGREMIGETDQDGGASVGDVLVQARVQGFAPEGLWPYAPEAFAVRPSPAYRSEAQRHHLLDSLPLAHDLDSILWHLASGRPVVVGVDVMPSFEAPETARTGDVPMPRSGEDSIGGHAIALTGWDTPAGEFTFDNSWGPSWGRVGRGRIPYDYILDAALCGEIHAPLSVRDVR